MTQETSTPRSYVDRLIASRGDQVHKLKAKDSTRRWAYYFVYVPISRERQFLSALKTEESVDLDDYGQVIGSCYGEGPNDQLRQYLKDKYGFDV